MRLALRYESPETNVWPTTEPWTEQTKFPPLDEYDGPEGTRLPPTHANSVSWNSFTIAASKPSDDKSGERQPHVLVMSGGATHSTVD